MFNTLNNTQSKTNHHHINHMPPNAKHFDAGIATSETHISNLVSAPIVILRLRQVLQKIGIGRSKLYLFLNPRSKYYDPDFPRPITLGLRSVGWNLAEVERWLQKKLDERPDSISSEGMTLGDH